MKRLVNVSEFELSTKWPMGDYVGWQPEYEIHCHILKRVMGVFHSKYLLEVEGEEENIRMYIEHLKFLGFKIR